MLTFADKVIAFNEQLRFEGILPSGIRIMNPFAESEQVRQVAAAFYRVAATQPRCLGGIGVAALFAVVIYSNSCLS